jgi:hypothetical protein
LRTAQAEHYQPTEADRKEAKAIQALFHLASDARAQYDTDWNFYLNFIEGNQLWYMSTLTGSPVQVLDPLKRKRYSQFNVLKPTIRALRGKLSQAVPTFSVRPGVGAIDQTYAARMGDRIIEWYWDKERILDKFKECVGDLAWSGIGVLHQRWNPHKGEELASCEACGYTMDHDWTILDGEVPVVYCPQCPQTPDPETGEMVGEEMLRIWSGDAEVTHVDPRCFFPQQGVVRQEDWEYCFTREPYPTTKLAAAYPAFAAYLRSGEDNEAGIMPLQGYGKVYNLATGMWVSQNMTEQSYLIRYFQKAGTDPEYPNGREVHMINGVIVEDITPMYPMYSLPFYVMRWETLSGSFYPTPPMADAWPRQKELNELETVFREYAELCVRPKLILPWGTKLAVDEVSAVTGQVLTPMPNYAHLIKFLQWPDLPPFMMERREQLIGDVRLVFGVTQTDVNLPVDGSGRTLAIQQAESDQSLGHIISPNHAQLARLTQDALELLRRCAPPSRKLAIMSDDGFEIVDFQAQNYGQGWGIALESDDGMPKNRALRVQEAINLAGAQVFHDPKTGQFQPALFAKAAKLKVPGLGPDQTDSEFMAARRAINKLKAGPGYVPNDEDDMNKFAEGLLAWLRRTGRIIQDRDQQSFEWVTRVRQLLRWYMQQIVAQQMAQMQTAAGGPPGMGSPPGSEASAPGGSPAKQEDTSGGSPVIDKAKQDVKGADQAGEAAVRSRLTAH